MRTATEPRSIHLSEPDVVGSPPRARLLGTARILSWLVVAVVTAASLASVLIRNLYPDETPWAREAFRGGDLVTLVVAVPLLIGALVAVRRGSIRAQALWIGVLFYTLYMYAYAVFGATFNDVFLLHIAAFSLSMFALACALPAIDLGAISAAFRPSRTTTAIGVFLVIVGALQGGLWVFVVVRNAINGEVIHDIPVLGQHLVFALDLAMLVPMLIVSGVLLARRRPAGYLLAPAMAVMGAITQLNLNVASVYQANADVPGSTAFPAEGIFLTLTFVAAAILLFAGGRWNRRGTSPATGDAVRLP
jgi:hypothetical protein